MAAPSPDAVLEAKRQAAFDLMREGKAEQAVSLMEEFLKKGKATYRDYHMLAKAHDKLGHHAEAAEHYRRALDAMPAAGAPTDEKALRLEIERRLKTLDAPSARVAALEDELLKKVDAAEREILAAKDPRVLVRFLRLRGGILAASGRTGQGCYDVHANKNWQESSITVAQGRRYKVQVAGTWKSAAGMECGADGVSGQTAGQHPVGALLMRIGTERTVQVVPAKGSFEAAASGALWFSMNKPPRDDPADNTGSLVVLVWPE